MGRGSNASASTGIGITGLEKVLLPRGCASRWAGCTSTLLSVKTRFRCKVFPNKPTWHIIEALFGVDTAVQGERAVVTARFFFLVAFASVLRIVAEQL